MSEKIKNNGDKSVHISHTHKDGAPHTVIIGEMDSRKQVFNIQSSGTKPYDTNNMLKPSGSNNQNKNE